MTDIVLPVSLGEALDKLTILDIKISRISDSRKEDCLKEYNTLYKSLRPYVQQLSYYYRILKEVNLTIWNLQENVHKDKNLTYTYGKILKENDRRFRIKKKINEAANSNLKEQKGYVKTQAFIYTHLGLGDMFWMNGSIRYLSTCYDELTVVCKKNNEYVVKSMYSDDPSIKLYVINDDNELYPFTSKQLFFEDEGYTVYSCGYHANKPFIYDFPHSFYDDLSLPRTIRTSYFYVPDFQEGLEILNTIQEVSKEYILIHQKSSQKTIDIFSELAKANPEIPILDINLNHYSSEHKFHQIGELVVNKPMIIYKQLIMGAKEIYCLESSFYCFASHLDLSKVEKKICYLPHDDSANRLGVFTTGNIV